MTNRSILWLTAVVIAAADRALAQQLRRGILDADAVVVARHVGVRPLGNDLFVHSFRTVETLKGEAAEAFSVVERKRVADIPKPSVDAARSNRLCCLRAEPDRSLPSRWAPYYRLTGYAGDHAVVGAGDRRIEFARTVLAAESGQSPRVTVDALVRQLGSNDATVRIEIVQLLRERPVLRDLLSRPQRSDLLLRAVGETEDVPFKIALASLCAECRMDGVIEALCMASASVDDQRFWRAVGRLARHLHGEDALGVLRPAFLRARTPPERGRLLLAVGATETESALDALLRMRRRDGPSHPVDAALRAHGSPRAIAAVGR